MAGFFEIRSAANDRFFFNLKAGNGEIILTSGLFPTIAAATTAIDAVKLHAPTEANFERKVAANDKPYFLLRNANGETLGRSEQYASTSSMENGIKSVMRNAAIAGVKDLTEAEAPAHR